ncbi:hypothetical protein VP424E501_P0274 [Vibrio phage 424E50-1]|nr:hypothetical protein VP424E501_P0274 [Vibrio phage 424E50-1]
MQATQLRFGRLYHNTLADVVPIGSVCRTRTYWWLNIL